MNNSTIILTSFFVALIHAVWCFRNNGYGQNSCLANGIQFLNAIVSIFLVVIILAMSCILEVKSTFIKSWSAGMVEINGTNYYQHEKDKYGWLKLKETKAKSVTISEFESKSFFGITTITYKIDENE